MREMHQENIRSIDYAHDEAMGVIDNFRSRVPVRKPNLLEYTKWLNSIEDRLRNYALKQYDVREIIFYSPGARMRQRLNEISFTPDSITWTWENAGGRERHFSKKSVKFYLDENQTLLKLEKSEFLHKHDENPLTTTTIILGNGPKASLFLNGVESQVPLDTALVLFSKPK